MAVEAFSKTKLMAEVDDDDDDMPLVFKRSSTTSKQNQSNSSSQKQDGRSGRQASDVRSPNGQSSSAQKVKAGTSSKASRAVSPFTSPKASPSSGRTSPAPNSRPSASAGNQAKDVNQQSKIVPNEPKQAVEPKSEPNDEAEDSEDDKPLSARLSSGLSKSNSSHANKVLGTSASVQKSRPPKKEDSDDEIPLASRFQLKSNAGASTSKSSNSEEVKPKIRQNGLPSTTVLSKRPPGDVKSAAQASVKKPRLSDASTPVSSKQASVKPEKKTEDDDDDVPISQRIKKSVASASKLSSAKKATKVVSSSMKTKKKLKKSKYSKSSKLQPSSGEGQKWTTLVHNGVIFPPPYKPHGVKMLYKGKPVDLTPEQEEVATMYAVMLDTDYMSKLQFKENFMNDWRKILGKNHVIQNLDDCDFTPIYEWHQSEKEKKKQMSTEEKKALREEKLKQEEKYMWAIVDGVKEKVGNFRVEPPGLFRGRGEHPKMGKLKRRIRPNDITINIGKGAPIPECPIPGERWKEVRHDNTVTWLAFWNDPINPREFKYVFLAASSSLKGQSDKEKYEKARRLKDYIEGIRSAYTKDFTSKDPVKRQIAVATYLIDKLALRAGNEKDDDEADTVGCCTLKVENVEPVPPNILKFDFLGKDSIRYQNEVAVYEPVFKAIQLFRSGKKGGDDLFDKLDTSKLNAHLKELMPGLTAKVFRTYNASVTLEQQLTKLTQGGELAEKVAVYNLANKEVAIICNHQRSVSKSHSVQISKLNEKIDELKALLEEFKVDLARAKKGKPPLKGADGKAKRNLAPEALQKKIDQTNVKIENIERQIETKEELKTVALGTSKINYLDPRITVAWCKRHEVPIEKMFNKSLLAKFAWAMDVEPSFTF
ncbi:DNA topoisomerase 1 alpha-like [Nicotiana tomentosiformis]|uniref:DNA topoisomerase 1 alpha-like n=1 Tax=Nicotiana tomentosiformis TaxID=4098 RepID=UPI000878C898|nr:DNA topoisomerase 1 alpha-like isoform X1 [Nicotiana tomentosiformis]